MSKHYPFRQLIVMLAFVLLGASCQGQEKERMPAQVADKSHTSAVPIPHIARTGNAVTPWGYAHIIKCSLLDKDGNLWFGTSWAGVFRYNGHSFTNFTQKDGLSSNAVQSILQSRDGNIWLGTEDGLTRYNGTSFYPVAVPAYDATPSHTMATALPAAQKVYVVGMAEDTAGSLWFGTWNHGAYRYDGHSFTHYFGKENIQSVLSDSRGNIWLDAQRFDGNRFLPLRKADSTVIGRVFTSLEDNDGNLWFSIRGKGVYRYNGREINYFSAQDGLFDDRIAAIYQDKSGKIWFTSDVAFGTKKGEIAWYDGHKFSNVSAQLKEVFNVWTMIEDRAGNLWLGTRGMGLWRYDGKSFTDYSAEIFR